MSLEIRFTGTRPNTAAAFWWDSTDPEISSYCQLIRNLADASNIAHSYVVSGDQLSFTSSFTVGSILDWQNFNTIMGGTIPGMKDKRLAYFQEHQHTLQQEFIDNGEIVASHTIVL